MARGEALALALGEARGEALALALGEARGLTPNPRPAAFARSFRVGVMLALATPAILGAAQASLPLQSLEQLEQRLQAALVVADSDATLLPLDRRLRLRQCPDVPEISGPQMGTMVVRCAALGWRVSAPFSRAVGSEAGAPPAFGPDRRVATAQIIRRGVQVLLIFVGHNFTVRAMGFADQEGRAGERIRVRNERRTGTMYGLVQQDGTILMSGLN